MAVSLGRRLAHLEGRHGRRPDTMTTAPRERAQREHLDREIERLLAEMVRRGDAEEAARTIAEVEAEYRSPGA